MARLVLTDTSPLIGLARVSGLGLLQELFGKVSLTPEVLKEALPGKQHPDEQAISRALEQGWLVPLDETPTNPLFLHLGDGEASCLRMALQYSGTCLLIMDDRLARRAAQQAGIAVVGIAGIIGLAQRRGLIPSARAVFEQLLRSDFRIGRSVVEAVLATVEGREPQ